VSPKEDIGGNPEGILLYIFTICKRVWLARPVTFSPALKFVMGGMAAYFELAVLFIVWRRPILS
jgi:hypothetical protein